MSAAASDIPPATTVFEVIGKVLGVSIQSEQDALRAVTAGLPVRAYRKADRLLDFPADLIGSETSIRRRLTDKSALSAIESERLVRVLRVFAEAVQLFGAEDKAVDWMKRPARYLQDSPAISPLELSSTDSGARLIENQLRRTAYGML